MATVSGRHLHPMGVTELLDRSFSLYRENFWLFTGVVAVLQVPLAILNSIIVTTTPTSSGSALMAGAGTSLLGVVFSAIIAGALARAISSRYLGRETSINEAYASLGSTTAIGLVVASIIYGIVVSIGFILLIIPGIYLVIRFLFVPEAIAL
ncbi:MAG: hypothetical protein ACRDFX_11615 [Chloroflexota bacterium]